MMIDPAATETLRAALFFGLLALLGVSERARPQRLSDPQRPMRWTSNFSLVAIGTVLLMLMPLTAIAAALWADAQGFGLFNQFTAPALVEILLAWLLLDLGMYAQHRAFHEIRWLWPLHRVHHSDVEFDVTTGLRFHPGELLLSQAYKLAMILVLGAPWIAALIFEIGLSSFALFSHANLRLAPRFERGLRRLLVTPDMHRIHHSVHRMETDSNYASVFTFWDRLFRSWRMDPQEGHRGMRIGLPEFRVSAQQTLPALLKQPFEGRPGAL